MGDAKFGNGVGSRVHRRESMGKSLGKSGVSLMKNRRPVVVDDCRFDNEVARVKRLGGVSLLTDEQDIRNRRNAP